MYAVCAGRGRWVKIDAMNNAPGDDLKDDDATFYEESINRIKQGVEQGMTFEQASSLVECKDEALLAAIIDDALKVLIAEKHFMAKMNMDELAKKLRLPLDRVATARQQMIDGVEDAAIEAYRKEHGKQMPGGNA